MVGDEIVMERKANTNSWKWRLEPQGARGKLPSNFFARGKISQGGYVLSRFTTHNYWCLFFVGYILKAIIMIFIYIVFLQINIFKINNLL